MQFKTLAFPLVVMVFLASLLFGAHVNAADCNTQYQFKAYKLETNGSYSLKLTTTNANYLISWVQSHPTWWGYVKGQDLVCDGYDFWSYGGGNWWPAR